MDLSQLLNQTTIQNKHKDDNEDNEESTEVVGVNEIDEICSEPEPEPEPEPETDNRFQQSWNKLEKGMKMNRILQFVENENITHQLSTNVTTELKQLLLKGCENGLFNKQSDVKYNEETCIIESFKSLEFNESTKKYKLKSSGTKTRSVSKSRSNIDRLLKKK